ncbi:serine-threonine protein kinase [Streptomyces sp. NPDC051940]|uniref:serine-threonine protein kinase n=1 Tax=Streptomyces sp. NPDC051940 TaxID=3155675 RepID=UPI00343972FB
MSVSPYWELTFDAEGDVNKVQLTRLEQQCAERGITDLVVFSHGWNNDRSIATRLYSRFFAPFPELTRDAGDGVRLGYTGVLWPSMRFTDEPIPDFERSVVAPVEGTEPPPWFDPVTQRVVGAQFPGHDRAVERIRELLDERPEDPERLAEFLRLVRHLVPPPPASAAHGFAPDMEDEPAADAPLMLDEADPRTVFEEFAAVQEHPTALWDTGQEILRQATYYAMKRRAGVVGERGLGPALGRLAKESPGTRVHLVGHSFGARLVSFAVKGLPKGVVTVASLTLLQGAFSHYAFSEKLPHDKDRGGALRGVQRKVRGPVVACYSEHDGALRTFYPLASRMARDSAGLLPGAERWGAVGYDGFQAVTGCRRMTLREALEGDFPAEGCVAVDAAAVVRRGGAPSGAHSDICHPELARVVLAAGRVPTG